MQLELFGLNKTARPHPISILVEKRDAAVHRYSGAETPAFMRGRKRRSLYG